MQRTARRFRIAAALVAAMALLAVGLLFWQLRSSQRAERALALEQTETRASQFAAAVAGRIDVLVRSVDFALLEVLREYAEYGAENAEFRKVAESLLKSFPEDSLLQLSIADAEGTLTYSNLGLAGRISIRDREHFTAHVDGGDRLFISKPVLGRVSNRWSIQFSRPLLRGGRFAGVAVMSISPEHIGRVLTSFRIAQEDNVGLFDAQGTFLSYSRKLAEVVGKTVSPARPYMQPDAPARGVYRAASFTDGRDRIFGWERVPGTALVASVAIDAETVLAPQERVFRQTWVRAGTLGGALLAFAAVIILLFARVSRNQQALAASEARFREFAKASGDWFWETDAAGRFIWISPQMEECIGYAPEPYLGRRRIDVVAEGLDLGTEPWKSHLETIARREPFRDLVYRRQTPKGLKWLRVAGMPHFDQAGRFLGYRGSAADATDAIEGEERLRSALDHLSELVVLCDAEDRIVYANRGFREFNAAVADHLAPGTPYVDHLRAGIALGLFPDAIGNEQAWIAERMALRRNPGGAVERRRQDGKWLMVWDQPLPDGGVISFGIDITERKRAEQLAKVEHTVTRCLGEAATARTGLEAVMRVICEAEGWDLAEYWACDESAGAMRRIVHWVSAQWPAASAFVERSRETVFQRGEGLPGTVWQSAEPLWVEDLQSEPRMLRKELARDAGMHGALLAPVAASGRVVGVLMFVSRELRAPDARLKESISAIAQQIGQLVQRRRAEDALREQTERLRIGQSVARMIVMDWDIRKDEIEWSDSPVWLRGPVPADTGKYPLYKDQIHPGDRERFLAERARALETLQGAMFEYRIVRTDGEVRWILSQQAVFAGLDGKAARMLVALHDITERKRAEQFTRIEHTVTRNLAEAATVREGLEAVMRALCEAEDWDLAEFWEIDGAAGVMRRTGHWVSPDRPVARTFVERSRDTAFERGAGLVGWVWQSGEPLWVADTSRDPRVLRKDLARETAIRGGLLVPILASGQVTGVLEFASERMRQPDERLQQALGPIGQQIGHLVERKRAEQSALLAAERIRMAAQAARMFSWIWEIETDTLLWLESPEPLLGPRPASGKYPDFRDLVHPLDREAYAAMSRQFMASGAEYEREFRIVRTDGEVRWLRGRGKTILDARGRPTRMVGITLDVTESKHAEEALQSSKERLNALVATALEAIVVTDASQRIVIFNRAAEAIFGYRADDAMGMPLERLIPPRHRDAHRAHVEGFATSGVTSRRMGETSRVAGLRADGSEFPAEASIMQFSAGGERFLTVMLRDVSEQERTDRELRERSLALELANAELATSSALLRGILDSTGDAILALDASGRVVAWNRRLVDLSELSEELLRAGDLETIVRVTLPRLEDPDRFRSEFERISGDPAYAGTRDLSLKDGRVLERHTQPIDAGGKPSGRVWSYRDITPRVRAERERESDRQFLQTVLDAIPTVIVVTDRAHRNVRVNRAMAELLGRRPEELIGRVAGEIYAEQAAEPGALTGVVAREEQVLASGEPLEPYEVSRRDASGAVRYFRARKLPLRDAAGNITHVLTVGDDVTVLRNTEEQLRRLNDDLEQRVETRTAELRNALRELESFSYSVSHDLRAPARAVAGFARIVSDDYGTQLPDEGRRLLARISGAGEAMGAMVDGLLELSRLTRAEVVRRPVDLVSLAAEVWRDLTALEPARRVELHMDAELRAEGDLVLLRNLLLNLLGNARKYTRDRADAAVWLGRTAEGEYFVRDNGVGFDMHYAGKLFAAFQRLHSEREFEGHGIGLALAKKIVERHGGTIRAEAAPGHGATFYFTLGNCGGVASG